MKKAVIMGGKRLQGSVEISGAKNASLPELAASLLTPGEVVLERVPRVKDVETMLELLLELGAEVHTGEKIRIKAQKIEGEPREELFSAMRASVLILGPLLARFGRGEILWPGGCSIGKRPINFHLDALRKMGAEIQEQGSRIKARAKRLKGERIRFPRITVTGTENIMMAATLAKGETLIENPAREPEVKDLALLLQKMGAEISWEKDGLHIEGKESLGGAQHRVIPDRIEAGTFLIIGALSASSLLIKNVYPGHLKAVLQKAEEAGVNFTVGDGWIEVKGGDSFRPLIIETQEYPGFPTDMQAQMTVLLCFARGESQIKENIFPERFRHALELKKMGADIEILQGKAIIRNVRKLKGTTVQATDLRASASLVIAGLMAEGETVIEDIFHLKRGYEDFFGKLRGIGAEIREE